VSASITRTISPFIIFIELNGHNSHLTPLMIAVASSYYVSEKIKEMGFFDLMADLRGFEGMR